MKSDAALAAAQLPQSHCTQTEKHLLWQEYETSTHKAMNKLSNIKQRWHNKWRNVSSLDWLTKATSYTHTHALLIRYRKSRSESSPFSPASVHDQTSTIRLTVKPAQPVRPMSFLATAPDDSFLLLLLLSNKKKWTGSIKLRERKREEKDETRQDRER